MERNQRKTFWWVYLLNILTMMSFTLTFRFADYMHTLGYTQGTAGLIVALGVVCGMIIKLAVSIGGEQMGIKSSWLAFALAMVSGHFLFLLGHESVLFVYGGRALVIVGYAGAMACSYMIASSIAPLRRETETLALFGSSSFLAMALGAVLLDYLQQIRPNQIDYFNTVWTTGIIVSALAALLLVPFKSPRKNLGQPRFIGVKECFQGVFLGRYLWPSLCLGMCFAIPQLFLARIIAERGIATMGMFFIAYAASSFVFRVVTTTLSRTLQRESMVVLGSLGFLGAQVALLFIGQRWHLIFPALLTGFGRAVMEPSLLTLSKDNVPIKYRATGTVFALIAIDVGLLVSAPVLGAVLDLGGINFVLYATSAALTVNLLWVLALAIGKTRTSQLVKQLRANKMLDPDLDKNAMATVMVTDELHPIALNYFKNRNDINFIYEPGISRKELLRYLVHVDVLIVRIFTKVDQEVFAAAPKLRLVGTATAGMSHIDLEEAKRRGVMVFNCPGSNANSTAELTIAGILNILRQMHQAHTQMQHSAVRRRSLYGHEARNLVLGLWGYGRVGQLVASKAKALGMKVLVLTKDDSVVGDPDLTVVASLDELAARSDILSLHVPLTPATAGRVNSTIFNQMKHGSYVVNMARGEIVAENDLLQALNSGQIAGAYLDVMSNEKNPNRNLVDHPQVLCTPHLGGMTYEAMENVARSIVAQAEALIDRRGQRRQAHKLLTAERLPFELGGDDVVFGQILDLDDSGLGIEVAQPLNAGDLISLPLANGRKFEFNIAWCAQIDVGKFKAGLKSLEKISVELLEQSLLAALPHLNERQVDRDQSELIIATTLVTNDGRQFAVSIINRSDKGYGLSTFHPIEPGTTCLLADPEMGNATITIVWCSQTHSYSFQLGAKLDVATVPTLLASA